jgi:hypothetical protein
MTYTDTDYRYSGTWPRHAAAIQTGATIMTIKTTISNPGRSDPNGVSNKNKQSGKEGRHTEFIQQSQKSTSGNRQSNASIDLDHNIPTNRDSSEF